MANVADMKRQLAEMKRRLNEEKNARVEAQRELKVERKERKRAVTERKNARKAEAKFEKKRNIKANINYRGKQKLLKRAKSQGNLDEKANLRGNNRRLNKLIIKAAEDKHDEEDSDDEEEAEEDARDHDYYPIRDTIETIRPILVRKGLLDKKFKVEFKSYLNPNLGIVQPKDFMFRNYQHYKNWIEVLDQDNPEPLNSSATIKALAQFNDVLKYVKISKVIAYAGGCNNHNAADKVIKTSHIEYKLHNPKGKYNNCGLRCLEHLLKIELDYKKTRTKYKLGDDLIDIKDLEKIYNDYNESNKKLLIIEREFNDTFDFKKNNYIFLNDNHYLFVKDANFIDRKDIQTKRGLMCWDIETRPTEEFITIMESCCTEDEKGIISVKKKRKESYILKDTITAIAYYDYKSNDLKGKIFETDRDSSSVRKFIAWLANSANDGKFYNCIAHNSAKFDHYFLLGEMNKIEQEQTDMQLRGFAIIGLQYCSHLFKDSRCYLEQSLDSLCKSFDTKVKKQKIIKYNNRDYTNEQLCFYKPKLTFNQFLELKRKEPEFWKLYKNYCLLDCQSLMEIWQKFKTETTKLIKEIDPRLLIKCSVNSCNTIGSLSMKTIKTLHSYTEYRENRDKFFKFCDNKEKFDFVNGVISIESKTAINNKINEIKISSRLNSQKTGGISHCAMIGHHNEGISEFDVASQYPASLVNMLIPVGESRFYTKYHSDKYGFYQLKNLVFDCKYKLKPVCIKEEGKSLNWNTGNKIKSVCLDSFMIKYLKKHYGLKSFDVVRALLSDECMSGEKLFGKYVITLYKSKAWQDVLKESESPLYNPALRETIKLFMNSLTGKLNEETHKYFSVLLADDDDDDTHKIGAINIVKEYKDKYNRYITAGVMTYSYSKRLLFEYIRHLPNNSDDVIHIETDGVFFRTRDKKEFFDNLKEYDGNYPVKVGKELGNIKVEIDNKKDTYFLGKKEYFINECTAEAKKKGKDDSVMKMKGFPPRTITNDGTMKQLISKNVYIKLYNGESVTAIFNTLRKQLYNEKVCISTHEMRRTIQPPKDPQEYY